MSKLHLTVISTLCLALSSQVAFSASFTLTSHELEKNRFPAAQTLSSPYGFGCSGGNLAPSFNWSGAPAGTQSFALKIYDRDAPTGLGWIHWQVVNIPSSLHSLP
ncbi:YbhB/YbcL family Raf kinase inhibitor-like protein, partial [Paenibacillus sp. SM 69]|nr:YbhB/YbcL family Raf kinase inhibitor-like protein [Paenibacillus oleatilyticus]